MRVLPVVDLLHGVAVRAVGGRRAEYRPLEPVCDPVAVARGYRDRAQHAQLYVADLDAIAGAAPARHVYAQLHAAGFTLWLDAGVRTLADALALPEVARLVVGLETVANPEVLAAIIATDPERVVFSLDLRDGVPLANEAWPNTARAVAEQAIASGVRRLLVLDLARVGMGQGPGTAALLADLHRAYPEVELLAGGGVRGADDLRTLADAGAAWVLVASALTSLTGTSS